MRVVLLPQARVLEGLEQGLPGDKKSERQQKMRGRERIDHLPANTDPASHEEPAGPIAESAMNLEHDANGRAMLLPRRHVALLLLLSKTTLSIPRTIAGWFATK
jgi:hypothetical protein